MAMRASRRLDRLDKFELPLSGAQGRHVDDGSLVQIAW
jgi:hypothetical protein